MESKPSFLIKEEKEKQSKEFLDKVQIRNKQEARLILSKYDLKHPIRNIIESFQNDSEKTINELNIFFQKRKEFLNLLAEYL
jgi:hypothetical protein